MCGSKGHNKTGCHKNPEKGKKKNAFLKKTGRKMKETEVYNSTDLSLIMHFLVMVMHFFHILRHCCSNSKHTLMLRSEQDNRITAKERQLAKQVERRGRFLKT